MANKKRIYTVATAHLDTIWSWDFETTVSRYIYDTLVDNIALFKKYPTYTFSFEGSYRYELMEEYYPELFEEMKKYIEEGRWNVCGSAFENGDTNCPSPEALFRNILIGNSYFAEKFGKRSVDIYLPDCFGFGWALPSIAHHSNLKGFTTQKLAWGSAYGVPFDIGKWYGVDGNYIYASCNPHDYYYTFTKLRDWDFVTDKLKKNEEYGLDWTYMFHGIGDRGGAPQEATVKFVEEEIKKNESSDIEVVSASADQIFYDIDNLLPQEVRDKLPEWKTELIMQNHGVGGYTSRAIGKRWNAKSQELGDMAERAGVMATYLGTGDYNEPVLERAWKRTIAHQFHDDTPGTSVQRAYKRSWNDYAMSINQFKNELESSLLSIAASMKTDFCTGTPIMVSNSLEFDRKSVVTAELKGVSSEFVRVFDDNGHEVKSQCKKAGDTLEVMFIADVKSLGVRVFDARPSDTACKLESQLSINTDSMSNQRYEVMINKNGDIVSITDKLDDERELLAKPVVLGQFNYTGSKDWPAWEMNFEEANKEQDRIPQRVSVTVVENGPVRATLEVKQKDGKSDFAKYISLTDGGNIVEVYNELEWQSLRTMCKNVFSLTAKNSKATFDIGLGAIERENMCEKLFEVPAQKWADITDESGEFGVSILSDCKHGWDKFNDNTLRLTALHTPKKNYRIDSMQSMMDLGLNRFSYAIFAHKGKVGEATQMEAKMFTQPLVAIAVDKHQGALGTSYSFGGGSDASVIARAIKLPHHNVDSGEIIVRFNEGANKNIDKYTFTLGEGVESARELYASEEFIADANVEDGKLVTSFKPYEIKTFALKLKAFDKSLSKPQQSTINIDCDITNTHIPQNLLPEKICSNGICFKLQNGLMKAKGQTIEVKQGNKLALLCASLGKDIKTTATVNGKEVPLCVNSMEEAYAQWDLYDMYETAYVKNGMLGYEFTHSVDDNGKTRFAKGLYFWVVVLDGTTKLPNNKDLVILSATEIDLPNGYLATPLEDRVEPNRELTFRMNLKERIWYIKSKCVWNLNDKDDFLRHWNNGRYGRRVEQGKKNIVTRTIDTVGH